MVKGNERRVVILKGDKGTPYDMACVFMRERKEKTSPDIVSEAQRIIDCAITQSACEAETSEKKENGKAKIFLIGVFAGVVTSFIIYALIVFGFGYGM